MNELVKAMRGALRHELEMAREFIANELARLDGAKPLVWTAPKYREEISCPPNYGNGSCGAGQDRKVPLYPMENRPDFDTAEIRGGQ